MPLASETKALILLFASIMPSYRRAHPQSAVPFVVLGCVFLVACAAGDARFTSADPAGFWSGLWHGLIAPFAFVIGLFSSGVEIYERANNGAWYDLGFLFGIGCLWGGSGQSHRWWKNGKPQAVPVPSRVTIAVDWAGKDEAKTKEVTANDGDRTG